MKPETMMLAGAVVLLGAAATYVYVQQKKEIAALQSGAARAQLPASTPQSVSTATKDAGQQVLDAGLAELGRLGETAINDFGNWLSTTLGGR